MSSANGVDFLRERFDTAGQAPPSAAVPGAADEVAPVALDRDRQLTEFVRQHQTDLVRTAWLPARRRIPTPEDRCRAGQAGAEPSTSACHPPADP